MLFSQAQGRRVVSTADADTVGLIDGFVAGVWTVEREQKVAALSMKSFVKLSKQNREELEVEALALLQFIEPDAVTREVRFKK